MIRSFAPVASALLLIAPFASLARFASAAPLCVTQCDELAEKGELSKNISIAGCYVRVCQQEGRRLYGEAKYEEALASLDHVYEKLSDSPSFLMDLGLTLYALDRFDDALTAFERVLSGFPKNIRASAQRGHTLVRMRNFDAAQEQFERLLELPESQGEFRKLETHSYLRGNIGVVHLLKGEIRQGKKDLLEAIKSDGRNALAGTYINNVIPYLESGALDPNGAFDLVVSYEYLGLKRFGPAAERLKDLLNRNPRYAPGYQRLAEILRSYEEFEACEEALKVAQANLPKNIDLRAERLRCALLRLDPNSDAAAPALAELRKLQKAHPDNARIQKVLTAVGYPP